MVCEKDRCTRIFDAVIRVLVACRMARYKFSAFVGRGRGEEGGGERSGGQ